MSYSAELRTLESHFATQWAAATPVQYENTKDFVPPDDGSPYARFYVLPGSSFIAGSQGANRGRYRHPGLIQIDILAPEGEGAEPALDLADQASAIFRGRRVGDVVFRAPGISRPETDAGYFRVTVSIPFYRDEIIDTS